MNEEAIPAIHAKAPESLRSAAIRLKKEYVSIYARFQSQRRKVPHSVAVDLIRRFDVLAATLCQAEGLTRSRKEKKLASLVAHYESELAELRTILFQAQSERSLNSIASTTQKGVSSGGTRRSG